VGLSDIHIIERVLFLIPLILSLTVHEWAHAWSAARLGDDTARRLGRLTLNPIPHIDLVGTILLPLLGIPFGWAKPVPINPNRFRRGVQPHTGMMLTAIAGPISNLLLAIGCTVVFALLVRFNPALIERAIGPVSLLKAGISLNLVLAIFNLFPIPPLDGSRVVDGLISPRLRPAWERFATYGPIVLLFVIVAPNYLHFNIIEWPYRQAMNVLNELAYAIIMP
jgi:Zn-dependent protease